MRICFLISLFVQFAHYTASPTGSDPLISVFLDKRKNASTESEAWDFVRLGNFLYIR